ncbi:unnamed protein product, partial [Brenthis ino]
MTSVKLPRPLENNTRSVQAACPSRTHEDLYGRETVCDLRCPGAAQPIQQTAPGGYGAGAYADLLSCNHVHGTCAAIRPRITRPRR